MPMDSGARDDDLTERICPVPDWRVQALAYVAHLPLAEGKHQLLL